MNLLEKGVLTFVAIIFISGFLSSLLLTSLFSKPQAPPTIVVERPTPGKYGTGLPGWGGSHA